MNALIWLSALPFVWFLKPKHIWNTYKVLCVDNVVLYSQYIGINLDLGISVLLD